MQNEHIQKVLSNEEYIDGSRELRLAVYALYGVEIRCIQSEDFSEPYIINIGRRFMSYDSLTTKPTHLTYKVVKHLDSMKDRWKKKKVIVRIALLHDRTIALPLIGIFEPEIINGTFNTTIDERDMPNPRILPKAMVDYMLHKLSSREAVAMQIKNVIASKWQKSRAIKKGILADRRNIGRKYTSFRDMIKFLSDKLERDGQRAYREQAKIICETYYESTMNALGGKAGIRKLNQILRKNEKNRQLVNNAKSLSSPNRSTAGVTKSMIPAKMKKLRTE